MHFLRTFAGLYKRCCYQRSLLNSIDTQQYLNFKQNNVQIGFVNFNTEEKKRVAKMMQLLQESEAIEELGIGRVRDHFSNTLFPGTSTLQHHAKYFVLLPSLYYQAAFKSRRFQNTSEVSRYIKEAEVQITRQLAEDENGKLKTDVTGITGIITYKNALNDYTKYVKYDPAYIYGSGLARYGIIPDTGVERLILELNRNHFDSPHNKSLIKSEDITGDADDMNGDKQPIKTCGEKYDFFDGDTIDMALSKVEASWLRDKILTTCKDSMLSCLIEGSRDIPQNIGYFDIVDIMEDMPSDVIDIYNKSVLFAKLMHLIDWRFNYSYYRSFSNTENTDDCDEQKSLQALYKDCDEQYNLLLALYKEDIEDQEAYNNLFDYIRPIDIMLTEFCKACYAAIVDGQPTRVDELVKSRERTIKRERSKIGNNAYKNQRRGKPLPNSFRWETVRTIVNEIRNPQ